MNGKIADTPRKEPLCLGTSGIVIIMKYLLVLLFLLTSCGGPFSKDITELNFVNKSKKVIADQQALKLKREEERRLFDQQKIQMWNEINLEARNSFLVIKPLFDNKCMNCHDSNFKLPLYGRLFGKINPVKKHQDDGLKVLDYNEGFPFKALGNPPQIALLKSIRSAFIERTMPLKSFTSVYPKKKINSTDEQLLLNWIDPIIKKFEVYENKFNTVDLSIPSKAQRILELRCFRCHANGNAKGGFGNMENTIALINGKYFDADNFEKSELFQSINTGEMPPSRLEALSDEEINYVRSWLEIESKKNKPVI